MIYFYKIIVLLFNSLTLKSFYIRILLIPMSDGIPVSIPIGGLIKITQIL